MRLAILGATSQIAKDLVQSLSTQSNHDLALYARRPEAVKEWVVTVGLAGRYMIADFSLFSGDQEFDAVLNFVGVGDPAKAVAMASSIFDITLKYDQLVLDYLNRHPMCRYLFLSSGAVYGSRFDEPADANTRSVIAINNLQPQDWYGVAKLHAESRHRALAHLPVVDIRVFNYFSHTQDMGARFLITDIVRAIREKTVLKTSSERIFRDYLHPADFYRMVMALLSAPATNAAVDCYSISPVDKQSLLAEMKHCFGLQYEYVSRSTSVNATGTKLHYYSRNKRAGNFGYRPTYTALGAVMREVNLLF